MKQGKQRIMPFLTLPGKSEEAMNFYASVLPDTKIISLVKFEKGQPGKEGDVLNGVLAFMDQQFMFMDMEPSICPPITWATSFYIHCNDEAEFDTIFSALSSGGTVLMGPEPVMQFKKVAWVTDKFGITWQPVCE